MFPRVGELRHSWQPEQQQQLQHPESIALETTRRVHEALPGLIAFEFYSGIGGLRVSLEKAVAEGGEGGESPATTTSSFEINAVANSVRRDPLVDRTRGDVVTRFFHALKTHVN